MAKETTISITEVTIQSGKTAHIRFELDGKVIRVPIDATIKAYFDSQFVRPNPTSQQRQRFGTLMNLLRAAYKKGLADGGK